MDDGTLDQSSAPPAERPRLSVVIPMLNEADNVGPLLHEIAGTLETLPVSWELIVVDDGSRDGTLTELCSRQQDFDRLRILRFPSNQGQTVALRVGIQSARGEWIATMDGDMQNDPADVPRLIERMRQMGADMVVGWRRRRQDRFWGKRLPSVAANTLLRWLTGTPVHDTGCTLKVMSASLAQKLPLAPGLHRFIPALAHAMNARVVEIEVGHRPRVRGSSKYGWERLLPVARDLGVLMFLPSRAAVPRLICVGILFGLAGFYAFGLSPLASALGSAGLIAVLSALSLGRIRPSAWNRPVKVDSAPCGPPTDKSHTG